MKKKKIRFIDCGANIGQSAEWAVKHLSSIPGCNLKIDCFEANPELSKAVEDANSELIENGSLVVHNKAVDINEGKVNFYLQDWGSQTGSSLYKFKESVIKSVGFFGRVAVAGYDENEEIRYYDLRYRLNNHDPSREIKDENGNQVLDSFYPIGANIFKELLQHGYLENEHYLYNSVEIDSINLVSWLMKNVDFDEEFLVLKLDIEGTEFKLVKELLETGLYKNIDALLVEWTPLTKLLYVSEFDNKSSEVADLIKETNKKFKFCYDWQHPEKAAAPLLEYINELK